MGDFYEIGPAQLRHMQAQSEALIAANPAKFLTGPYRVALEPPVVEPVPVVPVVEPTPGQRAEALLRDVLAVDPVPANEVKRLADAAGIKPRAIRNARQRMGVKVLKRGRGIGAWLWALKDWEDVRP
jgi:hypothetical protein